MRSKGKRMSFGVQHPASVSQTTKVNKPGVSTLLSSHGGKVCRIIVKEKAGVENSVKYANWVGGKETYLHVWQILHSGHCQPALLRGVTAMSRHIPW